jgi:hypothetical protein
MEMSLWLVLAALVIIGLVAWGVAAQRGKHIARKAALAQLGFRPCPEQRQWLEETVTRIENNHGFRYEVRDPKRLPGEPAVYYYVKRRHRDIGEESVAEEEILFPLTRRSADGLVLTVKPSSLAHGLATRMLGALATGPWDALPDDLQRLEIPLDLRETNLVGALGRPGTRLYDLIDTPTLSVVQGLGDAGGMFVHFRDGWCAVSSASAQIPFRVEELVARIRPLLS